MDKVLNPSLAVLSRMLDDATDEISIEYLLEFLNPTLPVATIKEHISSTFYNGTYVENLRVESEYYDLQMDNVTFISLMITDLSPTALPSMAPSTLPVAVYSSVSSSQSFWTPGAIGGVSGGGLVFVVIISGALFYFYSRKVPANDSSVSPDSQSPARAPKKLNSISPAPVPQEEPLPEHEPLLEKEEQRPAEQSAAVALRPAITAPASAVSEMRPAVNSQPTLTRQLTPKQIAAMVPV